MTVFNPYCLRLVNKNLPASSIANYQFAGDNIERTVPISDSLCAWWRRVTRLIPSEVGTFFVQISGHRKACMASTKRPAALAKTSAGPRGRRVTLTLSGPEFESLSYYAGRFRLTPHELITGMLDWLPDQSTHKFTKILLDATKRRMG